MAYNWGYTAAAKHAAVAKGKLGVLGIIPANIPGIASPLYMYGTIPLAASFSKSGIRDD